ncbi:hypothetical protein CCDG5_1904 [[Clostridium] cellulosi]|uniref:Uncharacterized protein n=1 Tax=[Clostridium] cellulosi TaxID=29343 RepID=A0A078KV50_9FIRM|nr:hypothetical protein CCDG5_1904 [[Clostridium] cellulosi]
MKIKNVLLIVPSTDKSWKKDLKNKIGTAPLGVASLSSMLKFHGYQVKIVDMLVECCTPKELLRVLNEFKPDIIGISATYTESILVTYKIVKYIKKIMDIIIIAGGVHVTFRPKEALDNGFDYVVLHEGEATIIELLEYLKVNLEPKNVPGIAYRDKDNKIIVNENREFINNLDSLPFPDLLSLKLSEYMTPLAIVTSRGCPGDCIYCSSRAMSGKKYRIRSAESVFSEVFYLSKQILFDDSLLRSYLAIYDDTFTVNRKRLKLFCKYMISSKMNVIPWKCESRIDVLDEECIALMKKAGCFAIHVGVESANQHIIDSLNKHIRFENVEKALSLLHKYGIQPLCSFIIGNHMDTKETLQKTLEYIKHIIVDYNARVAISPNTPLPGTELYENASKYNIIIHSDNWEDYSLMKVILSTHYLKREDIRNIYVEFSEKINSLEAGT